MPRLEVVNPVARPVVSSIKPAPRLTDLSGKRVGLHWNIKSGGDAALDHTAALLSERFRGVTFEHFHGSIGASMRHATKDDADHIARAVHAVVGTTSD